MEENKHHNTIINTKTLFCLERTLNKEQMVFDLYIIIITIIIIIIIIIINLPSIKMSLTAICNNRVTLCCHKFQNLNMSLCHCVRDLCSPFPFPCVALVFPLIYLPCLFPVFHCHPCVLVGVACVSVQGLASPVVVYSTEHLQLIIKSTPRVLVRYLTLAHSS